MILAHRQRVPFRLWGRGGLYDLPITDLWFDLDGDGQGFESEWSEERFRPADETVNLGEKSYSFQIDRYGRGLTLRPLAEHRPDRPLLAVGAPAPAIRAVDVMGRPVSLEAQRGKVVLIAFAGFGCGWCRDQAPALVELERRYRGRGLVVWGVSWDEPESVKGFAREFGEEWPYVSEPDDPGPIHLAYRAISYPRFVLIGRDGRLVALDPEIEELEPLLRGLLASPN